MVTILPQRTSLGREVGESLGAGLQQGIQQGNQVGFQRNLLQNALSGLENLPKGTSPYQLASHLIKATAGIPGAERYVGQLFPLLLGQLRSDQAFGADNQTGITQGGTPQNQDQTPEGISPALGATAQSNTPSLAGGQGGKSGGLLGSVIPQDQIDAQARRYAETTGTGIEGYTQMQTKLMNQNAITEQMRKQVEQKAADIGIPPNEVPAFMQLAQKHKNAKTFDDLIRNTQRDYKEYKNLSTTLDKFSYPGAFRGIGLGHAGRQDRLDTLNPQVKRLVDLGFEQDVRTKLAEKQLSPTEIEERIHPLSPETRRDLSSLPRSNIKFNELIPSKFEHSNAAKLTDFLKKNINPDTSLLVLRDKLVNDKGYDWERVGRIMGEVVKDPAIAHRLTAAQQNELATVETEAPRQSLGYIFQDWGNIFSRIRGEK